MFLVACDPGDGGALRPRTPASSPKSTKSRVIGLVGSMSGPDQWRGRDAFEGADVSVQVLNRALAPREASFELVTLDDGSDPSRARAAVEQLATNVQTVGIVYAGPEQVVPELEGLLAETKIPLLVNYGDLYSLQLVTPHVFQLSTPYLWEARVIARYALTDRKYSRVAALTSDSMLGAAARRSLTTAFGERSAGLVASEVIPDGPLRRVLAGVERKRAEALVVEGAPGELRRVLEALRATGARYVSTSAAKAGARRKGARWAPQVIGFDGLISPAVDPRRLAAGTVAADSYARGAHYLPIPSFEKYSKAFADWWGDEPDPIGSERLAYESVQMLGWAARRYPASRDVDFAAVLERLRGKRFGGLDVTFGPDDRTAVGVTTVGLWTIPSPRDDVAERIELPESLPWVPLARGFSIDGERTSILPRDWEYMFTNAPPKQAPAPLFKKQIFGVTTGRSDPLR